MRVIENPDFHFQTFCFIQDGIQIMPPFFSEKVRMRTGFNADRANAAFPDALHSFPKKRCIFTMLPEKWKNVLIRMVLKGLDQSLVHSDTGFLMFLSVPACGQRSLGTGMSRIEYNRTREMQRKNLTNTGTAGTGREYSPPGKSYSRKAKGG